MSKTIWQIKLSTAEEEGIDRRRTNSISIQFNS